MYFEKESGKFKQSLIEKPREACLVASQNFCFLTEIRNTNYEIAII